LKSSKDKQEKLCNKTLLREKYKDSGGCDNRDDGKRNGAGLLIGMLRNALLPKRRNGNLKRIKHRLEGL